MLHVESTKPAKHLQVHSGVSREHSPAVLDSPTHSRDLRAPVGSMYTAACEPSASTQSYKHPVSRSVINSGDPRSCFWCQKLAQGWLAHAQAGTNVWY